MRKIRSAIVSLFAAALLLGCASTPQKYEVNLSETSTCAPGKLCGAGGPREGMSTGEKAATGFRAATNLGEQEPVRVHRAMGLVSYLKCVNPPTCTRHKVVDTQTVWNVKTTAGIDFTFAQTYGTSAQANGLNYIALSNDSLTETTASTTLSNEITTNGLARHIGSYAHSAGASTATISYTFTCATNPQAAQKAALFSATSSGTMHHVLSFTQRSLQVGDQLAVTFTITLTYDVRDLQRFEGFALLQLRSVHIRVVDMAILRSDDDKQQLMAA
jgi:hypothetical protein